ncbi:beta-galactosidase [Glaciecola sp. KUL10]|uniref:beta-galactosidase n=1 Tax=Glaciecola sp. (strain KUL10) TaxID=2161813 RepID=UPI000D7870F2|nr:beta-galactosidase [Glaciecola sp. KUL10]GBL05303.1 beta-agarase [Glaciecola sp. KUL10]
MKYQWRASVAFVPLCLLAACSSPQVDQAANKIHSATKLKEEVVLLTSLSDISLINASIDLKNEELPLHVSFQSAEHPYSGIVISPEQPWDWSKIDDFNIGFTISNPGENSVQLYLDITDRNGANYTRTTSVGRGDMKTYYAKMAGHDLGKAGEKDSTDLNFISGLRSNPDTWSSNEIQFTSMWGTKNLDLSGITRISLSVQSALFDKEVVIHDISLRPNPAFDTQYLSNIVDQYGQNAKEDFKGKIHNDEALIIQRDKELASLKDELPDHLSKWSGWKNGPKLNSTGYFRTEKVDGKWYLVDPDGYLYFATGIDIIRLSNSTTLTGYDFPQVIFENAADNGVTPEDSKGLNRVDPKIANTRYVSSGIRANMFNWLPDYNEPLGKHFGYRNGAHSGPIKKGETYSFYSANLDRKYSSINPDYLAVWQDVTIDRMRNWGFSSLGNWTDPDFYSNTKIPFFANGWVIGDYKTVSSGNDFWSPMPDVFDPEFANRAEITVKQVAKEVNGTPWCVGVFIDNEKSFGRSETPQAHYGIVINTLTRDGKSVPTKAAFTNVMKSQYGDIDNLNKAWDTKIDSWKDFDKGIDSIINTEQQLKDYGTLLYTYADRYFSVISSAMDKHMPNHMYLGSRFPDWGMPIEVVKASAKYVDVVSYNIYKEGVHPKKWEFLSELDMPSIIGEFHMGALDSGLYHPGLIHASNQEDRAKMYSDYMKSVIDNPYFVGAHWFQYIDSPITGRAYDGENYNVGFVSVTDVPYQPMVDAAKKLHSTMYQDRFEKK